MFKLSQRVLAPYFFESLHSNLVMPIWLCSNFYCIPLSNEKLSFTFQSGYVQISSSGVHVSLPNNFTFQSGYIQIAMATQKTAGQKTLHSNLVIFKCLNGLSQLILCISFTFQSGYIQIVAIFSTPSINIILYIPIWLYSNQVL